MTRDEWIAGFWKRVGRFGPLQCWPWLGYLDKYGYGQLKRADGKTNVFAHRASLEIHRGIRIPSTLVVMHGCDNPRCVNPHHLSIGTVQMNTQDMHAKGRAPDNSLRGEANPSAKLSDADVAKIRMLYELRDYNKVTQVKLAEQFGVTQAQISRIVARKSR